MKTLPRILGKIQRMLTLVSHKVYYKFNSSDVACNICNYQAHQLSSDLWHKFTRCPGCGSGIRVRLLWAAIEHLPAFSIRKVLAGKRVLHFSPEIPLGNLIKKSALIYKTADFFAEGYAYDNIDYDIDISRMTNIKDASFDCVIACDVLEHVTADVRAIEEVYRILATGGHCIFTVPQQDHLAVTLEDLSDLIPSERENIFGQKDHMRIYGDDFSSRLENCGFKVTSVDKGFFSKEIAERNVLYPPVLSNKKNATNFRKVFIGVK